MAPSMEAPMDPTIETLARLAGLDKALADHPDDVAAAYAQAASHRATLDAPEDPAVEPWPPMHTGRAP
jgi:hypothetical protein